MYSFLEFIEEATSLAQGGTWDRIKDDLKGREFEVLSGDRPIVDKQGDPIGQLDAGDTIEILSPEERKIRIGRGNHKCVYIKARRQNKEGWFPRNSIKKPGSRSSPTKVEDITIGIIKKSMSQVYSERGPFTLYLDKKHKMKNVVDIVQPNGDPKADFVVLDHQGRGVGFISHKKGGGAKAYQQYGGISRDPRSGILQHGNSAMIEEIDAFLHDAYKYLASTGVRDFREISERIYRPVKNEDLISFAIYGYDFHSSYGLNHVNIIGQGKPIFEEFRDGYNLTFDDTVHHSPDISWAQRGPYQAFFALRNDNKRDATALKSDLTIPNKRAFIVNRTYLHANSIEV